MSNQMFNVSVRLSEDEKKRLDFLMERFNRGRIGKITQADILRYAIEELYIVEFEKTNAHEKQQKELKEKEALERVLEVKDLEMSKNETAVTVEAVEVPEGQTSIDDHIVDTETGEILEEQPKKPSNRTGKKGN